MKHTHTQKCSINYASELDLCDIMDLSDRECKFLGLNIEPFSFCLTCNYSLFKAVKRMLIADIVSVLVKAIRVKKSRPPHALIPD